MATVLRYIMLFSLSILGGCGSSPAPSHLFIANNNLTNQSIPESLCKVQYKSTDVVCSGFLIAHDKVMTAAHCEYRAGGPALITCIGGLKAQKLSASSIESFSPRNHHSDFVVLTVENKVHSISPMEIVKAESKFKDLLALHQRSNEGPKCFIAGFGLDEKGTLGKPNMAPAQISKVYDFPKTELKYALLHGENQASHGDSGGPLYCKTDSGWKALGIITGTSKLPISFAELFYPHANRLKDFSGLN